jgi:hypothetical protein
VFCISLSDSAEFGDDPRIDAVHSLWRATTQVEPELGSSEWPIQAMFDLLVRLEHPVPKKELFKDILKADRWPEGYRGKFLSKIQIVKLANILCEKNPRQAKSIRAALR